jgi:hypothetical protein
MSFDFPFVRLFGPYLYTFSLNENPSFIIFSAETEYISTRSWYRNINFLRDRIPKVFFGLIPQIRGISPKKTFVLAMFPVDMFTLLIVYIYFTEFGVALTTVLLVLFKYCYKYCYSDSGKL